MNIKKPRAIRTAAAESLAIQANNRKIPLIYAGFSALLSLAVTVISYILSQKINQMTGLANLGNRAIFSTIKSTLPVAQLIFLIGWEMSYLMCAMRLARRRVVEPQDMKTGFSRFWPILRAKILMGFVYLGLGIAAMYASVFIFMALPISNAFYEVVAPLLDSATILNSTITIDEATLAAVSATMWPVFLIFAAVFVIVSLPTFYGFRMVSFCIADNCPRGALAAMKASRTMMKGHKRDLFKLDLSFWWFFLLEGIIGVICYLDVILPMVGISLPWSNTISYYAFYILSLGCQAALYWAYLNRVTVSRAVFYDAIRPQESATGGVALGNIFELAKDYYQDNEE